MTCFLTVATCHPSSFSCDLCWICLWLMCLLDPIIIFRTSWHSNFFRDLYSFFTRLLPQSLTVDMFYVVFISVLPPWCQIVTINIATKREREREWERVRTYIKQTNPIIQTREKLRYSLFRFLVMLIDDINSMLARYSCDVPSITSTMFLWKTYLVATVKLSDFI